MAKTCNNCGSAKEMMELKDMPSIPFAAHEAEVGRQERQIKRLWIALVVAISMLFASFALFVWYESQFETISYDYTQDGQGTNIIGDSNEVNNGAEIESKSETQAQE